MVKIYKTWIEKHVKSSYDQLRSKPWLTSAGPSDQMQRDKLAFAFLLWACQTYDLYQGLGVSVSFPEVLELYQEIFLFAPYVGLDNFFLLMKELLLWLRNEGRVSSLKCLAEVFGVDLLMACLRPVFPFLKNRYTDWRAFRIIHHQFFYLSRMTLDVPGLEERMINEWLSFEADLNQRPSVETLSSTPALRSILTNWLGELSIVAEDPHFSSGSTADASSLLSKKLLSPYCTYELFELIRSNGYMTVDVILPPFYQFVSKYLTVPKNALTRRTISMEPAYLNYWQSSVDEQLRRYIASRKRHGQPGQYIDFTDQNLSRSLALLASKDGNLVTVDLSSASDSISLDHVRTLYSGTSLLPWLLATRSTHTDINGMVVELRKFAPMGSRLSFPIESLTFAACGFLAEARARIPLEDRRLRVYGDDIIIEKEAYPFLLQILTEQGFRVNTLKTYASGGFREACGIMAYKGHDVTLPSFSRFGSNALAKKLTSEEVGSFCRLANLCYYHCLPLTRYFLVHSIRKVVEPVFLAPTVERILDLSGEVYTTSRGNDLSTWPYFGLLSDQPTNWRLKRRPCKGSVSPDYGYGEALLPRRLATADHGNRRLTDDQRYLMWLYTSSTSQRIEVCRDIFEPYRVPTVYPDRVGRIERRWTSVPSTVWAECWA